MLHYQPSQYPLALAGLMPALPFFNQELQILSFKLTMWPISKQPEQPFCQQHPKEGNSVCTSSKPDSKIK
jgi:hypothetical protein